MITITRKIGLNRGKPRLWIEGKALLDAGFVKGTGFSFEVKGSYVHVMRDDNSQRHIAGTADRPIIDINSGSSLAGLAVGDVVTISFN